MDSMHPKSKAIKGKKPLDLLNPDYNDSEMLQEYYLFEYDGDKDRFVLNDNNCTKNDQID